MRTITRSAGQPLSDFTVANATGAGKQLVFDTDEDFRKFRAGAAIGVPYRGLYHVTEVYPHARRVTLNAELDAPFAGQVYITDHIVVSYLKVSNGEVGDFLSVTGASGVETRHCTDLAYVWAKTAVTAVVL